MPLSQDLLNQPMELFVNIKYLESQFKKLSEIKKKSIGEEYNKLKNKIPNISMKVPAHTSFSSLSALPRTPGVHVLYYESLKKSPAPPYKLDTLCELLSLFEEVPPNTVTFRTDESLQTARDYIYFSSRFRSRHVAQNIHTAGKQAAERYRINNDFVVSSFLSPSAAHYLNGEIEQLNRIHFFSAMESWFKTSNPERIKVNKAINGVVFRSKFKVVKWQCTQHKDFVPEPHLDYVFYCTADYPTTKNRERTIADHYVPTGDVLVGNRVVSGFKLFDVAANEKLFDLNSIAWSKIVSTFRLEESEDFGVRVYLNEGRAI